MQHRGILISFEGLDHTGKTAQCELLKNFFDESHIAFDFICTS